MEAVPNWLEAAVLAAGLATVYVADDWTGFEPGTQPDRPPLFPLIAH